MMWRASSAMSRAVTRILGSDRPVALVKVEFCRPISRARLVKQLAERGLVAGERFGDRDAGVVGGIDDDALDQVGHFDLAVNGGKHGRAVRRRPAFAPGVFADGVSVVELDAALLDLVEQIFQRHQLGEACRLDGLIGVFLVQYAVAVGIEQDRGGHAGLKPALGLGRRRQERRAQAAMTKPSATATDAAATRYALVPSPAVTVDILPANPPPIHARQPLYSALNRALRKPALRPCENAAAQFHLRLHLEWKPMVNKARGH